MQQLSLDDVAALLVSLEPTDRAELARLRDALLRHADAAAPDDAARRFARDAAARLDEVARDAIPAAQAPAKLAEAGRLVGAALIASEAFEFETAAQVDGAGDASAGDDWAAALAEDEADAAPSPAGAAAAASPAPVDADVGLALPADADLELLGEFLTESRDYVGASEAALLALEADPSDLEAINTVFRAFHTVKGTAAFMGLDRIAQFAHHVESVFSRVREAEIPYAASVADVALRATDMLGALLETVQVALAGGLMRKPAGYDALFAEVVRLEQASADEIAAGRAVAAAAAIAAPAAAAPSAIAAAVAAARESIRDAAQADTLALVTQVAQQVAQATQAAPSVPAQAAAEAPKGATAAAHGGESTIRVRTDRLDRLIDMVGELVIAQSMIASDATVAKPGQHELSKKVTHAAKIVRELQDLSMSMRMVPLKATFQKIARLVRDLGHRSGKLVEFVTEGEEVEIDRHMVDAIGDPLVHMVRNSLDHGLEHAPERIAAGKGPSGTIRLRAYHSGGSVIVELSDDGRGLNRERIVAKAIQKGLVSAEQRLTDAEAFNLIFAPGFSTAEQVTDLSGRGVGMDVVRRNVEAMRGRIDIASELGRGSTFSLRLPLTLAITDGMLLRVGRERYIVPITNIHMSFRPEASMLSTIAGRGEMVRLRDEIMPIVRVHRLFDVQGAKHDPREGLLMIVSDGERRSALLVDELLGQLQVVSKPLGAGVGAVQGVAGGAILGDGHVGLILDVPRLVEVAREGDARAA